MEFTATQIADVIVVDPVVYEDERGFFMDTWQEQKYREAGIDARFVQESHSRSSRGALRGLHYQLEQPQGKLIRVIAGEAFDVAVDLRRSSPLCQAGRRAIAREIARRRCGKAARRDGPISAGIRGANLVQVAESNRKRRLKDRRTRCRKCAPPPRRR